MLLEVAESRLVELQLEGEINVALVGDLDDTPERSDDWALFEERYVAVGLPIFARLQRNSEDDDLPHTGRWTMKAIVVTDQAAGMAGMTLVERPEPRAAI